MDPMGLKNLSNNMPVGGVGGLRDTALGTPGGAADLKGPSFKEILNSQMPAAEAKPKADSATIKFSNHAVERMQSRGIYFDQESLSRIENAVNKAAAKGAKETLLLTDNSALIVSVKNKTVVTVMDKASLKDNVFTNIDSTVMI